MISRIYDKRKGVYYDVDAHQQLAYEHLMDNPRAALFLGMSLSKTVIALSYLYDMHYREVAIIKTLVVAPDKVARITWPDEIETWQHLEGMRYSVVSGTDTQREKALLVDAEIYIVSVDNILWVVDYYGGRLPYDGLILDEIDHFKSRGSKRFKKLRKAAKSIPYRVGMTGTPSPAGLTDLWAEMALIDDGERLGTKWGGFVDKYFTTRGNGMIVYEYKPRLGAAATIARKISDIALTMQTRDVLKLPDLIVDDVELQFSDFDRDRYDQLEREYVLDLLGGAEVTVKTAADLSNKLLQVSSGAIYEDGEGRVWHEVNTVKIEALRRLLVDHTGETFLVVYQYRHEVERIKAAFPFARELRSGANAVQDFRDWNEGKIRLLLIHPASAGHGLNLQFGGRRMVWFSLTWKLGHYLQTVARLLRRGQPHAVHVHRLIVKGTRDTKVRQSLEAKEGGQNFLMNEIKELRKKWGDTKSISK